jgi:hypothetical protein
MMTLSDTTKGKQSLPNTHPTAAKWRFVRNNNIFIKDLKTLQETVVTTDGKFNTFSTV